MVVKAVDLLCLAYITIYLGSCGKRNNLEKQFLIYKEKREYNMVYIGHENVKFIILKIL